MFKEEGFRSLFILVGITLAFGTIVYHNIEGWGWLDSFYFCVITLTTIGYGDISPSTDLGKIFTIMYVFMGLGILVGFVTATGDFIQKRRQNRIANHSAPTQWLFSHGDQEIPDEDVTAQPQEKD
ncbi:potassium channel family protein [Methanolobus sp.]|uniref:potassium channel family protein n=1 Tax=Methanolobus sp. TaxID=1874737 RepID=UPI0025E8EFD6|nr:potassium channel family protein [Methanolobus sp.]